MLPLIPKIFNFSQEKKNWGGKGEEGKWEEKEYRKKSVFHHLRSREKTRKPLSMATNATSIQHFRLNTVGTRKLLRHFPCLPPTVPTLWWLEIPGKSFGGGRAAVGGFPGKMMLKLLLEQGRREASEVDWAGGKHLGAENFIHYGPWGSSFSLDHPDEQPYPCLCSSGEHSKTRGHAPTKCHLQSFLSIWWSSRQHHLWQHYQVQTGKQSDYFSKNKGGNLCLLWNNQHPIFGHETWIK